jgi:hypothetical protein
MSKNYEKMFLPHNALARQGIIALARQGIILLGTFFICIECVTGAFLYIRLVEIFCSTIGRAVVCSYNAIGPGIESPFAVVKSF